MRRESVGILRTVTPIAIRAVANLLPCLQHIDVDDLWQQFRRPTSASHLQMSRSAHHSGELSRLFSDERVPPASPTAATSARSPLRESVQRPVLRRATQSEAEARALRPTTRRHVPGRPSPVRTTDVAVSSAHSDDTERQQEAVERHSTSSGAVRSPSAAQAHTPSALRDGSATSAEQQQSSDSVSQQLIADESVADAAMHDGADSDDDAPLAPTLAESRKSSPAHVPRSDVAVDAAVMAVNDLSKENALENAVLSAASAPVVVATAS
jgi:hypothetical protein